MTKSNEWLFVRMYTLQVGVELIFFGTKPLLQNTLFAWMSKKVEIHFKAMRSDPDVYLRIYVLSTYLYIYLYLSIYLFVNLSISIYLIIFLAMSVSIYLMNLSICSSIFLFYFIKIHISVSLRFDVIYRWFNVSMMSVINLNRAWHWDPNTKLFFSKEQFPNHHTGCK